MLVDNDVYINKYVADGSTTSFPIAFPFLEVSHIEVYTRGEDGEDILVDPSMYTITGAGVEAGGELTFNTLPVAGTVIAIIRNVPITQLYAYTELDNFPAESHENALAKLTMIDQQQAEILSRAVTVPVTSNKTSDEYMAEFKSDMTTAVEAAQDAAEDAAGSRDDAAQILVQCQEIADSVIISVNSVLKAATMTISVLVASGTTLSLPNDEHGDQIKYNVGGHNLLMYYNGAAMFPGEQYNEQGTQGEASGTVELLQELRAGDTLMVHVLGLDASALVDGESITFDPDTGLSVDLEGLADYVEPAVREQVAEAVSEDLQLYQKVNTKNWDSATDFQVGALIKGSDGNIYVALQPNGPSTSAVNPVGDASGTWGKVSSDIATFYFNPQSSTLSDGTLGDIAGECNVIKTGGKVIMIDVGGLNRTASIKTYLANIGVTKVDYLIITHYHGDHCGNIIQTSGGSPVNTLELDWSNCHCFFPMLPSDDSSEYATAVTRRTACINFAGAFCAGYESPDEGDTLTIGDFKLEFINCGDTARAEIEAIQDEAQTAGVYDAANYHQNDYSMCEYVHAGDVSVFYAADLEYSGEKRLVDNGLIHPCDLLKFPHHGSNSTTTLPFYIPFADFARTPRVVVQNGNTSAAKDARLESMNWTQSVIFAPDLKPAIFRCSNKSLEMVQCDNVRSIPQFPQLYSGINRVSPGDDLNDYTQVGTYTFMGAEQVSTMSNTPLTEGVASNLYNGKLVVMAGGINEQILQLWYDQGGANIYVRKGGVSGEERTFGIWKKIFVTGSTDNIMSSTSTTCALKGGSLDTAALRLWGGGNVATKTSQLVLAGGDYASSKGYFFLRARDINSNSCELVGTPTGSLKWNGNEVQTASDERKKLAFSEVPDAVLDAWGKVHWQQFKFKDAATLKGEENCRWHNGLVAQRVKAVFEDEGLDACAYGILCHDEWDDEYDEVEVIDAAAVIDDEGNEVTPEQKHTERVLLRESGDEWTVRYAEALAMEAACQRRRAARAEARLASLEQRLDEMEQVIAALGMGGEDDE